MQRHLLRMREQVEMGMGGGGSSSGSNSGAGGDGDTDEPTEPTTCPLQVHLRLLPVPFPYSAKMLADYENELRHPTGITVKPPPHGIRIEGVAISEACGFAYGLSGGRGIEWVSPFSVICFPVLISTFTSPRFF